MMTHCEPPSDSDWCDCGGTILKEGEAFCNDRKRGGWDDRFDGWLVGWFVGRLAGWLVDWLARYGG